MTRGDYLTKGVDAKYVEFPDVTDVPDAFPDVTQMSQMSLIYLPDVSISLKMSPMSSLP